ncbi:MAG: hypothetical protein ABI572_07565 [Actinomycetota bacterium]
MAIPPEDTIVRVDPVSPVVLPEHPSPGPSAQLGLAPATSPASVALRDRVPWPVPVAVAVIVLLVVAAFSLTTYEGRDRSTNDVPLVGNPAQPDATLDAPGAAPNGELAIGTPGAFTGSIRVGRNEDLLAILSADPTSAGRLAGAPVNGDAAVVQRVFGDDAFSVASPDGGVSVLVYVPGAIDELQGFIPGTTVMFVGTLQPTPADLEAFLGSEPASIASSSGVYVVAVPETVFQVSVPTA